MATILKNNIKPSGSTLKGLVATDSSGNKRDVKFVRQVNSNGVATTVYDTFKEYSYGEVSINSFSYGDIPANGNAITPSALTYSQVRTEVGQSGATYGTATLTSGATISYSGTGVNATTGAISATHLGATVKDRTKITTVTVTVTLNGKSASKSFDVYQQANAFVSYSYDTPSLTLDTIGDVAAGGGTSVVPSISYLQTRRYNYTSGNDQTRDSLTSGATVYYGKATNPTSTTSSSCQFTGSDLSTTTKDRTSLGTCYIKIAMNGKSTEKSVTVYQQANAFVSYSYDTPSISFSSTVASVPANGATRTCPSATYSQVRRYNYTSGNDKTRDTLTSGGTVTYGTATNPTGTDNTKVTITGSNLGSTVKDAVIIGTFYAKVTINGKSKECTMNVSQSANAFTEYEYDAPTFTLGSVSNIPASGGTSSAPSVTNIAQTRYYCYTSGHKVKSDTVTTGYTIYYGTATNPTSTTASSATKTASSLGTTVTTAVTSIGTAYVKVVMNGKSTEKNTAINQAVNSFVEYEYDNPVLTLGAISDVPAGGGKSAVPSVSFTQTRYYCYSSGHKAKSDTVTTGGTYYYGTATAPTSTSSSSCQISGSDLGTTTKSRTSIGTCYIKVSVNGKSAEKSVTVYQAANAFVSYSYDTPSVSVSCNDVPASGGSVTSGTCTYSQVRRYNYNSGNDKTRDTLTTGGTVTWSGGASNIASLGSTEKARTAVGSALVATVAMNGKTGTGSCTVYQAANAFVSYSYDNPTGLSITCGLVPAGGGSVTSGTVSGTCSQVRRYNYTAGNDQKRDTINPTYTGSWSGGASNIGSRGTTVDSANTSTGKTLTYTYTANSKSNTATCTVYQTRNVRTLSSIYLSPYQPDATWIVTVSNGNWNTVPASGGYLRTRGYANYTHTSGSPLNDQWITDDASLSWNTGWNSWITAHTNGGYYISSRGTSVGDARSATGTWTYGGKTATKAFTQQANAVTSTGNYNGWTQTCYKAYTAYQVVSFASVGDISAAGGSSYGQGTGQSRTQYSTSSYTKYEVHNIYTSGSHAHNGSYTSASGWTDGNAPAVGSWGNNTTVKGGSVSANSLGTTAKSRTKIDASTTTWNGVACSADIYQAANAKDASSTAFNSRTQACYQSYTEYKVDGFASVGDIPAHGGSSYGQGTGYSRTNYKSSSYTKYDYYYKWTAYYAGDTSALTFHYTSTSSGWTDGTAPSAGSWGNATTVKGSTVSGTSLGTTTTTSKTNKGNSTTTWNGVACSAAIYQAINAKSSTAATALNGRTQSCYKSKTEYKVDGFASVGDIPAYGGSSYGQGTGYSRTNYDTSSYTKYDYYYTWTAYAGDSNAKEYSYTSTKSGYTDGTAPSASAWGGNTTVTGSEVSGSNLTTTSKARTKLGSSSVTWNGKTASADIYQQANTYTDSWNDPSITAFGYATSSFPASGGTSAAPNSKSASQSGTRTFTSGSKSAISNSSFTWSYTVSGAGFSVNSSTGVVTAGANTGNERQGVISATVTGAGDKSSTNTYSFFQASGCVIYLYAVGEELNFNTTKFDVSVNSSSDTGYDVCVDCYVKLYDIDNTLIEITEAEFNAAGFYTADEYGSLMPDNQYWKLYKYIWDHSYDMGYADNQYYNEAYISMNRFGFDGSDEDCSISAITPEQFNYRNSNGSGRYYDAYTRYIKSFVNQMQLARCDLPVDEMYISDSGFFSFNKVNGRVIVMASNNWY